MFRSTSISHRENLCKQTLCLLHSIVWVFVNTGVHFCVCRQCPHSTSELLWEVLNVLSVHRWLWKAPLQCSKPSLSLASMAWACCLTISTEWSYSTGRCQEQHCCATRTERRRKGLLHCGRNIKYVCVQTILYWFCFRTGSLTLAPRKSVKP